MNDIVDVAESMRIVQEIESRQDEVLAQLVELERSIERVLAEYAPPAETLRIPSERASTAEMPTAKAA